MLFNILFIISFALIVIYLSLLGRWVIYKLELNKLYIYFPIGFIFINAVLYLTSILTNYHVPFACLLAFFFIVIIVTSICIIKDFSNIDHNINVIDIISIIVICLFLTYFSINTTLGNPDGFDSTFYLNMVSQNIGVNNINTKNIFFNTLVPTDMSYYASETYYYYGGVLVFLLGKIFTIFNINYYYPTLFIWIFQLLFNLCIGSIIVEAKYVIKNRLVFITCLFPLLFVFGKLYYNSVFGFFGNSWINILLSYAGLFLIKYFDSPKQNIRFMIYTILFSLCGLTTSGIFVSIFFLYGLFFFAYKEKHLLKEYSIMLILPLYNALTMERHELLSCIFIPFFICLFFFLLGDIIQDFLYKRKLIIPFLIISVLITFVLSRLFSSGLFDFTGFLYSRNQSADMTLNYLSFASDNISIVVYKIFILSSLCLSIIFNSKNKVVKYAFVLFAIFFNPFCCNFFNHYIQVYYRAYSIIINPFIIIVLVNELVSKIHNSAFMYCVCLIIMFTFAVKTDALKPIFYHYEFIPNEDYNSLYKMNNDEIDIINQIKDNVYYYKDENPYIITNNIFTLSMFPQGKYMYSRGDVVDERWSESEKRIFEIFYTPKYLGDHIVLNPDYDNLAKYINDAKVNYVVVDKRHEIYDKDINKYTYLFLKVNEACGSSQIHENNTYVLYRFS